MPEMEQSKGYFQRLHEWEWNQPRTMYGCNKLYCELLGNYYTDHYRQLAQDQPVTLDFRAVRFPGLISAFTLPSGGTSDYASEMIHAAAQSKPYACFVRPDARIPFMAMPDAATALIQLGQTPKEKLSRSVYNITSFSISAEQIHELVLSKFPDSEMTYKVDVQRQAIIDSWPSDMDDSAARIDWGWAPQYDSQRTFDDYLFPNITKRYAVAV